MLLTFEDFKEAEKTVDRIIHQTDLQDIDDELEKAIENIPNDKRRSFLNHLNNLFLNVLLNRIDDLGESAKEKSNAARKKIMELINKKFTINSEKMG